MPTWPITDPPAPLVEGYREVFEDRRIVFATEYGPQKARPRTSKPVRTFAVTYLLDGDSKETVEEFYRHDTRAGELTFDYPHPRVTLSTIQARFTGPPQSESVSPDWWHVSAVLDAVITPPVGTGSLAWPSSLPSDPLVAGYNEVFAQLAVHGDLPGGVPIARRRTTADPRRIKAAFLLESPEVVVFDGFYENDTKGGSLDFSWDHPDVGAVRLAFAGGPQLSAAGLGIFEVACDLEMV